MASRLEEVARGLRGGLIRVQQYEDAFGWRYDQVAGASEPVLVGTGIDRLALTFRIAAVREAPVGRPVLTREEASVAILRLLGFHTVPGSTRWQRAATHERGFAGFSRTPDVFTQAELQWELVERHGMTVKPYTGGWLAGELGERAWGRPGRADAIVHCALELEDIRAEFPDEKGVA